MVGEMVATYLTFTVVLTLIAPTSIRTTAGGRDLALCGKRACA